MRDGRTFWYACAALAIALSALEVSLLTLPGIQQDEALFLLPFLRGASVRYSLAIGAVHVPVMLMDYVGCLKTWLYWPIFHRWHPGIWSIRLPACGISLVTLLLFAGLVRRVTDSPVAFGAAVLLVSDASFVFTSVFDWGPVALLMAGTVGILALLVQVVRFDSRSALALAFFLSGVMLWYKAIFAFPLAGLIVAAFVVYRLAIRHHLTAGNLALAAASLLIGASPLLLFNFQSGGATLKAPSYLEPIPASEKFLMLRLTLNGKAFEHYMVRSTPGEVLPVTGKPLGVLVESWYRNSTLGPGSFLFPALLLSALALPFLRQSRLFPALAFAWVAGGVTFALFPAFRGAGGGPHHTVLLDPAPQFIVAGTAGALGQRWSGRFHRKLLLGTVILVTGSNAVLFAQYHRAARHNGFSVYWTGAAHRLAGAIQASRRPVAFLDWGLDAPTRIESRDAIQVVSPLPARPGVLYVTHNSRYQVDPAPTRGLLADARIRGLLIAGQETIADSHGHPVISVFSLVDSRTSAISRAGSSPKSP